MEWIMYAELRIGVILWWQSIRSWGLLVRFLLFVRWTYTYTCAVCNMALGISFQPNALLHTAWVYALSLSQHTHWCFQIYITLILHKFPLQIFTDSTIIWTCSLLQGHFNCHRQMSW
jgi:energy-coupling factor transporter transmembrane protein EcfT